MNICLSNLIRYVALFCVLLFIYADGAHPEEQGYKKLSLVKKNQKLFEAVASQNNHAVASLLVARANVSALQSVTYFWSNEEGVVDRFYNQPHEEEKAFVQERADNKNHWGREEMAPLAFAACKGYTEELTTLLGVKHPEHIVKRAIMVAAYHGHDQAVHLLCEYHLKNKTLEQKEKLLQELHAPLRAAVSRGQSAAVASFLAHGVPLHGTLASANAQLAEEHDHEKRARIQDCLALLQDQERKQTHGNENG